MCPVLVTSLRAHIPTLQLPCQSNAVTPVFHFWRNYFNILLISIYTAESLAFVTSLLNDPSANRTSINVSTRRSPHNRYPLADMGGFSLRPPDWVESVLDAKQVHYLVERGYVEYSGVELDPGFIEGKNKSDSIGRFISVFLVHSQLRRSCNSASCNNNFRAYDSRIHRLYT